MPAYLGDANRSYNQIRRIKPTDSIAQLDYYNASSSSSCGLRAAGPSSSKKQEQSIGARRQDVDLEMRPQSACSRASSSQSYSSKLVRLILRRGHDSDARRQRGTSSSSDASRQASYSSANIGRIVRRKLLSSGQLFVRRIQEQLDGRAEAPANSESPPLESSGFSEETTPGTLRNVAGSKCDTDARAKNGSLILNDWASLHQKIRLESIHHRFEHMAQENGGSSMAIRGPPTPLSMAGAAPRARMKRRKINRLNRRMLIAGRDANGNPILLEPSGLGSNSYALSELFSQSEIPGFREIFSSDSVLRKFCWVVAFLVMTVWSLHDVTELVTEYNEYPITVNVRLRDSPRLPFPAVTVCNLNVVRYTGLCSSSSFSRFDLANQMPSDLREKLCGFQMDTKKNSTTGQSTNSNSHSNTNSLHLAATPSPLGPQPTTLSDINNIPALTMSASTSTASTTSAMASTATSTQGAPAGSIDLGADFVAGVRSPSASLRHQERSFSLAHLARRPFASNRFQLAAASAAGASSQTGPLPARVLSASSGQANRASANRPVYVGALPHTSTSLLPPNQAGPEPLSSVTDVSSGHSMGPTSGATKTSFTPPNGDEFELTERQERELQENLTNWLAVMYQLDSELTRSIGHQFDDMILRCTMKSMNCTKSSAFDASFSPTEGNCFTYRSRRHTGAASGSLDDANLAGTNDGLELVLNLEKSEYITGSSQVGALVMVHHPDELGYSASEATFIAPEFTTYIGLKMINITRLPDPYPEHCVHSWPAKFQDSSSSTRNSTYSQQTCLKICLQRTIQAHCACQSALLPTVEVPQQPQQQQHQQAANESSPTSGPSKQRKAVIICDTRRRQTRRCVRDVSLRAVDRVHHCDCPPKCQVVRYDKTISVARWPTREDNVTFDRGKMDVNFQNLAKVIVYFQTMTCEEVTQQAVYNIAKICSQLGGIMGMYVGFSFLSVFEVLEVLSRKLWHYSRARWTQRASHGSSVLQACNPTN